MRRVLIGLSLLLCATLPPTTYADDGIAVQDPYIRLVPPGAPTTGAFMVISNNSAADRKLIRAASPVAKTVELHTHLNENGVMKMRPVPDIEIKAGGRTELKPGSYHVMLIDMTKPLQEGDEVPIDLTFDDGSTQHIAAPVRRIQSAPAMPAAAHGGMKH